VHAGCDPGIALDQNPVRTLTSIRRLELRGRPWWYELHDGPRLVLFGHTPSRRPRVRTVRGRLVALGLDTGCVYGGTLTAYSPELDAFERVTAAREYALGCAACGPLRNQRRPHARPSAPRPRHHRVPARRAARRQHPEQHADEQRHAE
jgi:hypothetical protein